MINDNNVMPIQIVGPAAAPRRIRVQSDSDHLDLGRAKNFLVVSEFDFYFLMNNDPAAGVTAANGMLWPGMTPLYISSETYRHIHFTRYNTNGWLYIVEVM